MPLVRRADLRRFALVISLAWTGACDRTAAETAQPTSKGGATADPADATCDAVLSSLQRQDRSAMTGVATRRLAADFRDEDFDHASRALRWLGELRRRELLATEETVEGQRRRYALEFDRGEVELEIDFAGEKVMGLRFLGDAWSQAELGAETASYDEFKVYEIQFLGPKGEAVAAETLPSREVVYVFVLGGMLEMMGEHHVTVNASVVDSAGKDVFLRPIVYETVFAKNPEGIPRGEVKGDLKVGGPGRYELVLRVADDVGHQHTEFRQVFAVAPSG